MSTFLEGNGFDCTLSPDAETAQTHPVEQFDILVVDIMLPGQDGLSFCQWVRQGSDVPIVILSAEKGDAKRIHGIELGADDYLEKPFNPRELLARMNALLRRSGQDARRQITGRIGFSGWILDRNNQKLHSPDAIHVPLSATEYQLLSTLASSAPEPVAREVIGRSILNVELGPEDRRVDILVSRLRKKIASEQPDADFIRAVRNRGYQFCADIEQLG